MTCLKTPHILAPYLYSPFPFQLILFTNSSIRAGYDTKSIFKRSLTGLNSQFSFSKTSCLSKAKQRSLPYYLPIAGGRIIGFIPNLSRLGFELESSCPFPTMIMITPRAPPFSANKACVHSCKSFPPQILVYPYFILTL